MIKENENEGFSFTQRNTWPFSKTNHEIIALSQETQDRENKEVMCCDKHKTMQET